MPPIPTAAAEDRAAGRAAQTTATTAAATAASADPPSPQPPKPQAAKPEQARPEPPKPAAAQAAAPKAAPVPSPRPCPRPSRPRARRPRPSPAPDARAPRQTGGGLAVGHGPARRADLGRAGRPDLGHPAEHPQGAPAGAGECPDLAHGAGPGTGRQSWVDGEREPLRRPVGRARLETRAWAALNGLPYGAMPSGGPGLRGTLVGCANADAVRLTGAERNHCNERFGVEAAKAPALDGISPAKRAAFDRAAGRQEANRRYRDTTSTGSRAHRGGRHRPGPGFHGHPAQRRGAEMNPGAGACPRVGQPALAMMFARAYQPPRSQEAIENP